jgi:hypothetical protein
MLRSTSSRTFARRHRRRFSHLTALISALLASVACAVAAASVLARSPAKPAARASDTLRRVHRSARAASRTGEENGSKADCIYTANSVVALASFERLVGRGFDCAMVYNNAAPDWAGWERPWFVGNHNRDYDWSGWVAAAPAGTHRQLIISNNLFPAQEDNSPWLQAGAAGDYEDHARALARNLVAAGLGNAVIRLAHEANGTGSPYSIGSSSAELALWRRFWRRTAIAMRSVPGAHFLFDWCVNAYWRPIPLRDWYPGDDVVDIVGIDTYDGGVPVGQDRWSRLYAQPNGIADVLRFAKAHHKPLSVPEWGLWPAGAGSLGGGSDPSYVNGIAGVVRSNRVAYQSYFFNHDSAKLLQHNAASLNAYRRHFGGGGDSVGARTVSPS